MRDLAMLAIHLIATIAKLLLPGGGNYSDTRGLLDHVPFWGARDLERKLHNFREYYNHGRVHALLKGVTPICSTDRHVIGLDDYRWRSHCRGLYQLPAAA